MQARELPLWLRSRQYEDLEAAFWTFHENNPHVYRLFCRFAQVAIEAGRRSFSARAIWQRIRWYAAFETNGAEDNYKLNNNHSAFYARLFMLENPEYDGLFETRDRGERSKGGDDAAATKEG